MPHGNIWLDNCQAIRLFNECCRFDIFLCSTRLVILSSHSGNGCRQVPSAEDDQNCVLNDMRCDSAASIFPAKTWRCLGANDGVVWPKWDDRRKSTIWRGLLPKCSKSTDGRMRGMMIFIVFFLTRYFYIYLRMVCIRVKKVIVCK